MSKTASIKSINNINENLMENLERRKSSVIKRSSMNLPQPDENKNSEENRRKEIEKINSNKHRRNHSRVDSLSINSNNSQNLNYSLNENRNENTNLVNYSASPDQLPYINSDNRQKTIICWNCNKVLLVGDDWDVVQCTHCDKLSKIPDNPDVRDNHELPERYDSGRNHFETNVPVIFLITICPYCGKQNKVHKGTQHVVCYKCHHSVNLESDGKMKVVTGASNLAGYKPSRSLRFSELVKDNQILPAQNIPLAQIVYPTNMPLMSANVPPVYPNNWGIDNYNRYYENCLCYECYPFENLNNHYYNPSLYAMMENDLRRRINREYLENERRNNEKRYQDKVVKDEIKKLKENIERIKMDLGVGVNTHIDTKKEKNPFNKNLNDVKNKIENKKSIKNEALYKSLIERK
jgi:hypothetical protein